MWVMLLKLPSNQIKSNQVMLINTKIPRFDRAILKLRNMREEYAVALRQQHEGNAPPLSMFRSQVCGCCRLSSLPRLFPRAAGEEERAGYFIDWLGLTIAASRALLLC